ncbi:hypothetical protein AAVH_26358 [Aphelenchoides avenae]|nr:hypothetical protein AAVH_26358 [Aphelenchus avenae]
MKANHDEKRAVVVNKYRPGDRVMVRHPASGQGVDNKLKRRNYGPFRVVRVEQNNAHILPWGRVKDISKGTYVFRVSTSFGPWTSPPRKTALLSLKTTCGLGPYDHCIGQCKADCTGVTLRDIAPDATLSSDPNLLRMYVPTLAQQTAVLRATRKLHGASLGELCKRLLTHPAEQAEKILVTSMYAPFDTSIDDILLPQARLRANRCALTRAALEASGDLPLTFIVTSTETVKLYTRLELEDGAIGLCMPGANIMGQAWEEVRSSGTEMLKDPFHVICTTAEKTFFEHSAAIVHVADDQLQKKRFFENNQFSGSCMAALVTLGTAERSPNEQEDLYDQLLTAVKKVNHVQIVVMPPPPIQNEAYVYQAKQLMEKFPELYKMTDSGGSLLQIGRYGGHADRRYVLGEKWNKDGILALKEYLVQVSGHTWLRNVPKANAAFPLRQMDQLHLAVAGNAPNPQPSTSARSNDSSLHTNRGGRINRSNDANLHTIRGGRINRREAPSRSGPHSTQNFDPQMLNDLLSALKPSSALSSKFNRHQKRK